MFLYNHNEIVARLKQYPIFNQFSVATLRKLVTQSKVVEFPENTILFHMNDCPDWVYYVIDGSIELFSSSTCKKKIAHIRSGEILGEASVLADETHTFTAKTNKHSQIIQIPKAIFLQVFQKNPHSLILLTQNVTRRLRRMAMGLSTEYYPFKNIVLCNSKPEINLKKFKEYFQICALKDNTHLYDKQNFEASQLDILVFLMQCENRPGINIFFIETSDHIWDKTVLLHADYLYMLRTEGAYDLPMHIVNSENSRPCDLVIWHQQPPPYINTQKFYHSYTFKRHHHCHDERMSYQRLYRYMTGQAIGLVISAGGFRGYAHYGLIKALLESGIPIDCIGGSSFGAAVGASLAENFDWEHFKTIYKQSIGEIREKKLFNFTFPFTSLLSGKLPTILLQKVYAHRRIEDLPLNFFCITGNLSSKQKEVKHFGELWQWIRASIAVPGILPPFEKQGNIYVDGAVCTALPVQDMREYLDGVGKVISLDVRLPLLLKNKHKYTFPSILTFKDVLAYKFGFSRKNYVLPSMLDILLASSSIEQDHYDSEGAKYADINIAPDTSSLSFSDPSVGDPQSLIAYRFAKEKLKESQALFARWS